MQVPWRRTGACLYPSAKLCFRHEDKLCTCSWWSRSQLGPQRLWLFYWKNSTWVVGLTSMAVTAVWDAVSNTMFGAGHESSCEFNPCDPPKIWFCAYSFQYVYFSLTDLWSFTCFSILVRRGRNNYNLLKIYCNFFFLK